jgi:hypothetical protein
MQTLNMPRVTVLATEYSQAKDLIRNRGNKIDFVELEWWVKLSLNSYGDLHQHLKRENAFLLCRMHDKEHPHGEVMVVERIHTRKEGKGMAMWVEARSPQCVDYRDYKKHPLPATTPQLIGLMEFRFG